MPHVISESGRALTAHHALLLLKVIDVESQAEHADARARPTTTTPLLHEMVEDYRTLAQEAAAAAQGASRSSTTRRFDKERAQQLFNSGVLSLRERAHGRADLLRDDERASRASSSAIADEYEDIISGPRGDAGRPLLLQLLALPVAARQLGDRPALPDHADPPARRGADAPRHAAGRHLRLRRQDRPVRRRARRAARASSCTSSATASRTSSASSSPARTRRSSATCTTCSATRTRCTSGSPTTGYEITDLVHGDTVTEVLNYVQFGASDLLATFRRKVGSGEATCRGRRRTRSSPTTSRGSRATRTSRARRRGDAGAARLLARGGSGDRGHAMSQRVLLGARRDHRRHASCSASSRSGSGSRPCSASCIAGVLLGGSVLGLAGPGRSGDRGARRDRRPRAAVRRSACTPTLASLRAGRQAPRPRWRWPASSLPFAAGLRRRAWRSASTPMPALVCGAALTRDVASASRRACSPTSGGSTRTKGRSCSARRCSTTSSV